MATGESAADLARVFGLLSDETRLDIVRALAERRFEKSDDACLSFSELRGRVGARDAGRFNYHLGQLRGSLVEKTPEGYLLTDEGVTVGALVLDANPLARLA
ncbi:helix-turn-helix domain-containing protein [Halorussus gelatinilyticus]|uniref:Helix-turn-helix domain-containing protein n=1 Tax=Halorussus gelatinilyticus TaxID=2937524 RepID=A0A8U0IE78_9EURY|nr:helix-turn-helix domain-containing protein [Halorussus gelatinilyticus]UPV99064.1 helix-turn-helix domain-containing protein [Halorussus gelatinilyticus]